MSENAPHTPAAPKRRWRWWHWVVTLLALPLAALASLLLLLNSEGGLRWLIADVAPRFVEGLRIDRVEGALGALRLGGIRYAAAGTQVRIDAIDWDWRPAALLSRHLDIARLHINAVSVQTPPSSPKAQGASPITLPEISLPLTVHCGDCTLIGLRLESGDSATLIERVALGLDGAGHDITLGKLEFAMPGITARASGKLALRAAYPLRVVADWQFTQPEQPAWQGHATVSGDLERLSLSHELTAPLALTLNGHVDKVLAAPVLDVTARWEQLAWPARGMAGAEHPYLELQHGELTVKGKLDDYAWRLATGLAAEGAPASAWKAHGQGALDHLTIAEALIDVLEGQLLLAGQIDWRQGVHAELKLAGQQLNPGIVAPDWPGKLALELNASAAIGEHTEIHFELPSLSGTLREQPIALKTHGQFADGTLALPELSGRYGNASLDGSASYGERLDATLNLEVPQLAGLIPDARGSLTLKARATGKLAALDADIRAQARDMTFSGSSVSALNLDAALKQGQQANVVLSASQVTAGGNPIAAVSVNLSGSEASHQLRLKIDQKPEQSLRLALTGSLSQRQRWQGKITEGDLTIARLGLWHISPATLNYAPGASELRGFCLHQDQARLCADAKAADGANWNANLRVNEFPLDVLTRPALPTLSLGSRLTLNADARSSQGALSANIAGDIDAGTLVYTTPGAPALNLPHQGATLRGKMAGNQTSATLDFRLNREEGVHARMNLDKTEATPWGDDTNRLAGEVHANLERLDWISAFAKGVQKLSGKVRADLALAGTLGQPRITGDARLLQTQADIPAVGLELRQVEVALTGDASGLSIDGGLHSGRGKLQLNGTYQPLAQGTPLALTLRGEDFQIVNLDEAKIWLSPAIDIHLLNQELSVTGELNIPEAKIRPTQLPASAVKASDDVVLVDTPPPEAMPGGLVTHVDLRVQLGEKVNLKGFGLTADLGGDLRIRQTNREPPTGQGELKVTKGTYEAYGQQLTIAKGRLIFIGPVTNPLLDLEAVRKFDQPEKLTVGIRGRGSVRKPDLRLFSDKSMEERDMLSYLLIGRPLGEAEGGQGQMLSNAALNMGLTGAAGLAQSVGERMGLSNTTVTTKGSGDETAVVLGTWLAPDLYIDYGSAVMSKTSPGAQWSLTYYFTKKFRLEAAGGTETGADLKYTLERD